MMLLALAGCSPSAEDLAAEQAAADENIWLAMGYEGPVPAHSDSAIRSAIASIAARSDTLLIEGSTSADCEPYLDAFKVLLFADFEDERNDYIAPLSNALSQVHSGCHDRGTWEGSIDDVLAVSELGNEYVARF